jgi:hypothetical protein
MHVPPGIYTKPKGQLPDYESPVVLKSDRRTIEDFCNALHKSIIKDFKHALVWGTSVKYSPQKVRTAFDFSRSNLFIYLFISYRMRLSTQYQLSQASSAASTNSCGANYRKIALLLVYEAV